MASLAVNDRAFVRPSQGAGSLSGVARKTRETIQVCEAAGYDVVLGETVGVGQVESVVAQIVGFGLLLPNAGDELQGIKRGILAGGGGAQPVARVLDRGAFVAVVTARSRTPFRRESDRYRNRYQS